jgi:hypothetical protein
MNRMLLGLLALGLMAASTGCQAVGRTSHEVGTTGAIYGTPTGCQDGSCENGGLPCNGAAGSVVNCGHGGNCGPSLCGIHACLTECARRKCAGLHRGLAEGPAMGAVTYPYYTVRGPRDFLLDDPPSVGR